MKNKPEQLEDEIKSLIDSSWKMGRYIFSTNKIELLRLAIIESKDQAILKERKRVIEFVKRKVLPAPKFGNEKEDILYQRLEKLTN